MMEEWGEIVFERKDILDESTIKQMEEMLERKMPDDWDDTQKKLSLAWGGNNIMLMLSTSYLQEIKRLEKKQKLADEYIKLLEEKNEINRGAIEKASMWEGRARCGMEVIENLHKENEILTEANEDLQKRLEKTQVELAESNELLEEHDINAADSDDEFYNTTFEINIETNTPPSWAKPLDEIEWEKKKETSWEIGKYHSLLHVFEIVKKTSKRIQIKLGDKTFYRKVMEDGKGKYILLPTLDRQVKVYGKDVTSH